jgi:alkylhydroperoxidase/carboxymuconolactone decarboxylase family protein YurZ
MTDATPVPNDERLLHWVMGDETSRTRMLEAMSGPAGTAYHEVIGPTVAVLWGRRILPVRTTVLMNLAILACLNRPHELYTRTLGLLRGGISVEEIQEVFLHVNFYAGNPAGVEAGVALHQAMQSLTERGIPFNMKDVAT